MKDRIELRNNFLDNLRNPLSKMEGTFNFDIAATFGITAEEVYKELEFWEKQTFIDTATEDEYIDKHALMFGVTRRLGTKATGTVKVTGKANSIIEENTIFLNRDGIKYKSLRREYLSTSGVTEIEIECLSEGKVGNAAIGEITTFEIQNSNIYSVVNEKEMASMLSLESTKSNEELKVQLEKIVEISKERNEKDNITVLAFRKGDEEWDFE